MAHIPNRHASRRNRWRSLAPRYRWLEVEWAARMRINLSDTRRGCVLRALACKWLAYLSKQPRRQAHAMRPQAAHLTQAQNGLRMRPRDACRARQVRQRRQGPRTPTPGAYGEADKRISPMKQALHLLAFVIILAAFAIAGHLEQTP